MQAYTFKDFDDYLTIYTDVIRNGFTSRLIGEVNECLNIMEYFEEYEKCQDLLPYITGRRNKPTSNMDEIGQD